MTVYEVYKAVPSLERLYTDYLRAWRKYNHREYKKLMKKKKSVSIEEECWKMFYDLYIAHRLERCVTKDFTVEDSKGELEFKQNWLNKLERIQINKMAGLLLFAILGIMIALIELMFVFISTPPVPISVRWLYWIALIPISYSIKQENNYKFMRFAFINHKKLIKVLGKRGNSIKEGL